MPQINLPRDIHFLNHILRFEDSSEEGEEDLEICDQVIHFYDICGHTSTRTSCHNRRNIELVKQAAQNDDISALHLYPCTDNLCDRRGAFVRYVHGSCPDCGRLGLGGAQSDNPTFNGITVIRSDPHLNHVPEDVIRSRRVVYRELANTTFSGVVYELAESSFLQTATDIVKDNDMFVPYSQQANPGKLSTDLENCIFNAWVHHRTLVEDGRGIPLKKRGFYVTNQLDHTPLLETVSPTDDGVAGGLCSICHEDHALAQGDPRRLPCGHVFHWKCITEWIYKTATNTCPECRQKYSITHLPWVSPL